MKAKMTGRRPSRANGTKGRFKKGDSKPPGSGRKRGTPNRKSATLKEAYAVAASLVGEKTFNKKTGKYEPGDDDLVGYMLHLARCECPGRC